MLMIGLEEENNKRSKLQVAIGRLNFPSMSIICCLVRVQGLIQFCMRHNTPFPRFINKCGQGNFTNKKNWNQMQQTIKSTKSNKKHYNKRETLSMLFSTHMSMGVSPIK